MSFCKKGKEDSFSILPVYQFVILQYEKAFEYHCIGILMSPLDISFTCTFHSNTFQNDKKREGLSSL